MKNKTIALAGAGIVAASALALGGAALASADETGATRTTTSYGQLGEGPRANGNTNGNTNGKTDGNTDPSKPMRFDETLLTGDVAATVTAAAKAKEPTATIERVETDSDGVYEAHMVRTDGTHITVQVDASFAVTAVQEGGPGGTGGPGGRGGDHDGDGPQGQSGQQGEAPVSPNGTATPPSTT